MDFRVKAMPEAGFDAWVQHARNTSAQLDAAAYKVLAKPSDNLPVTYYGGVTKGLYNDIVMKYMTSGAVQ